MRRWTVSILTLLLMMSANAFADDAIRVGTWKTAQTIQPFFYQQFLGDTDHLEVFAFTNPADQKTALLAGSLDMCGTTLAHAIHSATQGQPVVVVAALCDKCSALVVHKNSSIKSISDLRGKRIGYVPGTMHEILLRESLSRHQLNPQTDVKLTRVDFFDMGLALARGSIDAFLSGEPFPTLAVRKGYGRILSYPYYDDTVGTINAAMIVTRETIEKRPELVLKLVRAHAAATEHLCRNQTIWLDRAAGFGTDKAVLSAAAPNMALTWEMDQAFIAKVKALGQRMQALKVIDRQPDYDSLFDLRFVDKVRAERQP